MAKTATEFSCDLCDYTSSWKHNVTRHKVLVHNVANVIPTVYSVIPNVNSVIPKETIQPIVDGVSSRTCQKCNKLFCRKKIMLEHMEKCNGLSALQCPYCKRSFNNRQNKFKHIPHCSVKKELDAKASAVVPKEPEVIAPVPKKEQPIPVENTGTPSIPAKIITFRKNKAFLMNHIPKNTFRKILKETNYSDLFSAYATEIFKRPENGCIRKTNIKSESSMVHKGNDVWVFCADSAIVPQILCNIAMSFGDSFRLHNVTCTQSLDTFLDDVTCDGEHGNDNPWETAQVNKWYKIITKNIVHIIYTATKSRM